jgi:opine dehydrogenase
MKIKKIAVLGGGNGGVTVAADQANRGFEVNLFDQPAFFKNLLTIKQKGGVLLKEKVDGKFTDGKFVKLSMITDDINEAVKDVDAIIIVVPSFAVEAMAKIAAPAIGENQMIMMLGSDSMNAYRFMKSAREAGVIKDLKISAASSLPYGTRVFYDKAEVELSLKDKSMMFAALPSSRTTEMLSVFKNFYDCLFAGQNVLETTLNNGNPESHAAPCIYSAARIETSKGEFWLYREGMTENTVRCIKAIDKERQVICRLFGFDEIDKDKRLFKIGYFDKTEADGVPLQDLYKTSKAFYDIKGPMSITNRYLTEDIPMGLVFWSSLGKAYGVPTPAMDAVVTMGSILLGEEYWKNGLTLESLGLSGLSVVELMNKMN